ncbi:MAG: YfhO family protein [Coprococcus sp.]|nr:YfhO family protein [Coprococcus sp.]
MFGAKVDWISQHSVLPDYFRSQFYETGSLIPEFAGNLGGGQNIYHFSYYGLYSPIILLSYLLPFVKMSDYLMAASVVGLWASVSLLYYWLVRKGFSEEIALPVSVLFLLAGPMVFQSCRQVMFVNYMPFLCLAFIGVDRHFEKGKSGLYAVSVFLMIMTSFYFSIGGMLSLALYGLAQYIERRKRHAACAGVIKSGFAFLLPMISAVFMSGILLVPTAYAILGKRGSRETIGVWELLIPDFSIWELVHSGYGVGLTTGMITVLLTGLAFRKWNERILYYGCMILLTVPVFSWLLNGGLYIRNKVWIPFLPLLCYLTAVYLKKQKDREISLRVNVASFLFTFLWLFYGHYYGGEMAGSPQSWYLVLAESAILAVCFGIFWRSRKLAFLTLPSLLCLFLCGNYFHNTEGGLMEQETYARTTDSKIGEAISKVLDVEPGLWRLEQGGKESEKAADLNRIWDMRQWISSLYSSAYNTDYQDFRKEVFGVEEPFRNDLMQAASDNPLYQKLMGVKYIVRNKEEEGDKEKDKERMDAVGYELFLEEEDLAVYKSENTAPIAYVTDQVIREKDYDRLEFPYNQTALAAYAVVRNSRSQKSQWEEQVKSAASLEEISIGETEGEDLSIRRLADGTYHIKAKKNTSVTCSVSGGGELLFLQMCVENKKPSQDAAVWVNGTRNKISAKNHLYYNGNTTFTYAVPLETGAGDVELTFGKGEYVLSDIACFRGKEELLEDRAGLYQSAFEPDWEATKGKRIQGTIQVKNTGYFITSIPYDSNFEIRIDGKRTVGERVNKAFLGFSIREGEHQVEIVYHAQGVELGKYLSCLGVLMLLGTLWGERRERVRLTSPISDISLICR